MKQIHQWLNTNNSKTALNAINQLNEPSLIIDAIRMGTTGKFSFQTLNIDAATLYLNKCVFLFTSKYYPHVNAAVEFVTNILPVFQNVPLFLSFI